MKERKVRRQYQVGDHHAGQGGIIVTIDKERRRMRVERRMGQVVDAPWSPEPVDLWEVTP